MATRQREPTETMDVCPLPTDEIHLWYVEFADVATALSMRYEAILDDEESARRSRFRFQRDQRAYVVSHALLRTTLSQYAAVAPTEWRFVAGPHGRPEIAAPNGLDLRFNLSHTRGAALVGVVRRRDVGVDLESVERTNDGDALAARYFSPHEVRDLQARPDELRRAAFFEYWTLKEAYVKARGLGLHLPLDRFSFRFEAQRIQIAFESELSDVSHQWQFAAWKPDAKYQAAAAVRVGNDGPVRFVVRRVVPLGEIGPPREIAAGRSS